MTVMAINVLQDPDPATVVRAMATNARLRGDYPDGFALDANHMPHIALLQRFVQREDLADVAPFAVEQGTGEAFSFRPLSVSLYQVGNTESPKTNSTISPILRIRCPPRAVNANMPRDAKTKNTGKLVEVLKEAPRPGWVNNHSWVQRLG